MPESWETWEKTPNSVLDGLSRSRRKIENLPSDEGRAFDILAGAILRLFSRVNDLDRTLQSLLRRLNTLEKQAERPFRDVPVGPTRGPARSRKSNGAARP
jgi:hypothetical protein